MTQRLDYKNASPKGFAAMLTLEQHARTSGLEHGLLELVKTRVSQLNGCAFCLDMHTKDARAAGESEQRLYLLPAWREAPMYSPRERAALAWAEAVTLLKHQEVPDDVYQQARQQFDEKALVDLTLAIVAINGWNRLSVAFRAEAGSYQPGKH
ncbi:MAG: carboxymuconolactone decarboxylase family protein [Proteobacteria bacterium]|nr:carboxymuconolactone decarboxylase family protein [Pseudomonadota bacterium]